MLQKGLSNKNKASQPISLSLSFDSIYTVQTTCYSASMEVVFIQQVCLRISMLPLTTDGSVDI